MEIFVEKFGGASVNSAESVRNVEHILSLEKKKRIVVISAMGKTTNKLENIINLWFNDKKFFTAQYEELVQYHHNIIHELFDYDNGAVCMNTVDNLLFQLKYNVEHLPYKDYNFFYDGIVSFGEKISTAIVSAYLNYKGMKNKLISAVDIIKTDNNYRDANVNWQETQKTIEEVLTEELNKYDLIITQGFIGGTKENLPTTLGREGSDFSAAIIAHCLNAKSMTVWKDVPGLLNADPKRISDTTHIISLPYTEAVELSYYGAAIIHPKTVKPLENLSIPLYIKSFISPSETGTVICDTESVKPIVPNYIFKDNQVLLSISPKDFSFATESNISKIFSVLAKHKVKVNLIQNSAISFSVCFDENKSILPLLLEDFQQEFSVRYNTNLQLITIRHYTQDSINKIMTGKRKIIEQKNRITAQFLVNAKND